MQSRVIDSIDELVALAPAWDALADDAGGPALSRPFFCIPWARHLAAGSIAVIAVTDADRLVGLAPLHRRPVAGVDVHRFIGHGLGTVSSFLTAPGREDADRRLWDTALSGRRRFIQLLEQRSPLRVDGRPNDIVVHDSCLVVDCDGPFERYLASRSKKLRENMRRAERATAALGGFEVEVATTASGWASARDGVLAVYDAAEDAQPRDHILRGRSRPFAEELLTTSAESGHLRLFVGRVGDRPVTFGIAFATGATLSFWLTRFDPEYRASSVGGLLLREVIAHGFDHGFRQVDLMLGDQGHKRRWSTGRYDTLAVLAAPSTPMLKAGKAFLAAVGWARSHSTRFGYGPSGHDSGDLAR